MAKLDLNLLFTLQALLRLKSTTLAAQNLNTSQSAVSRSLTKIRSILGDEILVRKGQKLELTCRGKELESEVPQLLQRMEAVFTKQAFNPVECTETITVAMNASIAEWLAPLFFQFLEKEAPGINLIIDDWEKTTPEMLNAQSIRIGVNYFPIDLPKSFIQRKVGRDSFVLVCRTGHALSDKSTIRIEDLKHQSFIVHLMKDWNDNEPKAIKVFREHDLEMDVRFQCRHMSVLLRCVLESNIVFLSSTLTVKHLDERYTSIPLDNNLNLPIGDIGLFYSNKFISDPMTKWLNASFTKIIKNASGS